MPEATFQKGLPLTYAQFSSALVPEASLPLPVYTGSMFRGAFGSALKQVVCVTRTYDCPPCLLKNRCLYPYVFETPPPPDSRVMRKYTTAPHPFVLEPPMGGGTAETAKPLALGMTLFGKAIGYLPHFIFALEKLGQRGLGGRRVRCALSSVDGWLDGQRWVLYSREDRTPRSGNAFEKSIVLPFRPPDPFEKTLTGRVTIDLLTPLRVVYDSQMADELPFHVLLRNLLRRIGHLSYFHCGGDPSEVAFREWIDLASNVDTVDHDLKWFDWERYSSRQRTTMRMGGLLGKITFEGKLAPFYPFLAAGEVVHAGKGTSFGLGRFRIISQR
jgi:CRISPR-associated endoribonuclease Cas6